MKKIKTANQLEDIRKSILEKRDANRPCITICGGTGCHAYACEEVIAAFKEEIEKQGLKTKVDIRITGCHGFCERGPLVVFHPEGIFYQQVKPEDVPEIVSETIIQNRIIDRLLYVDPRTNKKIKYENEIPFYKKQKRLIFGNNGKIDPTDITDYIAIDGYSSLAKVLSGISSKEVIEEISKAGLRGRGGAGFPTGRKWKLGREAVGETKYIICNADEGDPGAYMDRSLLEGNPHSVLEGMIIGAWVIGANKGYIYVRNEYPLAVKNVGVALKQAEGYGFLGKNILGSGFNFTIEINRGAGAFVCGEETALIASIEGRRGMPVLRPPYPVNHGLWRWPTVINNVETLANVPLIIARGASWYSKIGTKKSKGTKIFSLVGKVKNTGLVEVPMGITLREIVYDIGGGVPKGRKFKAVQIGGPSGGCIPERYLDLPIDYDSLVGAGAIMGSGGMVVMDDDTCMVDIARFFLEFVQDESCGKCVPCRIGTKRMVEILTRITQGEGEAEDIEHLKELARMVKNASLCGLGQTAPNPILSTLRYFRDEYEAHIRDKKCPARVCKDLITYSIDKEKCKGCLVCKKLCPEQAIEGKRKEPHGIDQAKCIKCGLCLDNCKFEAVIVS
jgi:NADH-quinone oxidoreductase subunit F